MSAVAAIFRNPTERRLRSGWRVLVDFVVIVAVTGTRDGLARALGTLPLAALLVLLVYLAAGLAVTWWIARSVDRRSFAEYGLRIDRRWWMDLLFGAMLGAFLMTGIFVSMRQAGWLVVAGLFVTTAAVPFGVAFCQKVLLFAAVAVIEELTFRGYQLRNLAEGFFGERIGARGALFLAYICTSALFGAGHLANEGATIISTLSIMVAGVLLALPFVITGELAVSIGVHFTWNLFQGPVYGFAVSGTAQNTTLLATRAEGPALWTGGSFGPEAGLLALAWAMVGCVATVAWVAWTRRSVRVQTSLAIYRRAPD